MGTQEKLDLVIANDMKAVGGANRSLEEFLERLQVSPDVAFSASVALEEVTTNVIKYGYEDDGDHEIHVEALVDSKALTIRVTDDGREFNPLETAPPDLRGPVEDRPVGGLGVHLLRNLAERVEYERACDKNILTLSFPLEPRN